MGNHSSTSSKRSVKKTSPFCCPCVLSKTSSSSSLSIDDRYLPTFDRITSNAKNSIPSQPLLNDVTHDSASNNRRSVSLHNVILTIPDDNVQKKPPLPPGKSVAVSRLPPSGRSFRGTLANTKRTYYSQSIAHARVSIEDLEKSLHGASSIDRWIDSLPILGTPSLNRNKTAQPIRAIASASNKKIKRSLTTGDQCSADALNGSYRQENESPPATEPDQSKEDFPNILNLKINRVVFNFAREIQLNVYLKDFLARLTNRKLNQTFQHHFSLSTIIYPLAGIDQILADDLNLFLITPPESLLPILSSNVQSTYKLHEQVRAKCYFIPTTNHRIEADDDEYKRKCIELDRTHVVITLENRSKEQDDPTSAKKAPIEQEPSCLFVSDDSFQTGFLQIDPTKLAKHFLPFVFNSTEENLSYLSSSLIHQWFNTLMLVNQTCAMAKRFLTGDGSHITCLIKQQANHTSSPSWENHLTFAALRLPPCLYLNESSPIAREEDKPSIVDAFSSTFLSDNHKLSNETIHIDYEQYSFAFLLPRWPKIILDNYFTQPLRTSQRKWPSKYHLNILIKKPLLLVPILNNHKWEISFDLIEQSLFELMNESTLCFYALCQQFLSPPTLTIRKCLKHSFLNYCETYGLPFSNNREQPNDNLLEVMRHFLQELHRQIKEKCLPHYFNDQINLFETIDNPQPWFDHLDKLLNDGIAIPTSLLTVSNRPVIVEFLFHFIDQLYQTFHIKRSQFHLNENVLLELHRQLCEQLSNDTNNNSTLLQKFINHLLNNPALLEHIERTLTFDFETNAELVHTCLNQVRKADSSLIFHYTWTIYVQYLHTYYNVLWNI